MDAGQLQIGQLAAELGLNPKTIRYYEELGLLAPPSRSAAGYRRYTHAERGTLRFIIKAKAADLTLAAIGEIMALCRAGREPCGQVREVPDRKLAAVEAQLYALAACRHELLTVRDAATAATMCAGEMCGIVERHTPRRTADDVAAI